MPEFMPGPCSKDPPRRAARILALACASVCAVGCTALIAPYMHEPENKDPLTAHRLWEWLPGRYDNEVQRAEALRGRRAAPPALRLAIVPVNVPFLGEHVFYSQESTADFPGHISSQRLLTFKLMKDGQIVEALWSFTDPPRWRGGAETPELFTSLQTPDIRLEHGCELIWKFEGASERFTATGERGMCRIALPGLGQVFAERRAELSANELAISDQAYDAEGRLVNGRSEDPLIHFRRSAGI